MKNTGSRDIRHIPEARSASLLADVAHDVPRPDLTEDENIILAIPVKSSGATFVSYLQPAA